MTKSTVGVVFALYVVMVVAIVGRVGFIGYQNSNQLSLSYDPAQYEKTFQESQWAQSQNIAEDVLLDEWALKNGFTGWKNYEDATVNRSEIDTQKKAIIQEKKDKGISDSTLYTYVGYKYATGTSPHLLNPEHPPFAKYLIGWSILIFGNAVVGQHIAGLLLLGVVSWYAYILTGSGVRALFSAFVVSMFSLFEDQLVHGPQLELYQALFVLTFLAVHTLWLKKQKPLLFIFSCLTLGLALSTKTAAPFIILFSVYVVLTHSIIFSKNKLYGVKSALLLLIGAGVVFSLTYYAFFTQGNSIRAFLGLQKYIITFYQTSTIPLVEFFGNYLRLITTGSWKFWDEARTVSQYSEWNISWPLIIILSIVSSYRSHKIYPHLLIFLIIYHVFLFFTPVFPRYLFLLFIPSIISIVSVFGKKLP